MNIDIEIKESLEIEEEELDTMVRAILQGESYEDTIWNYCTLYIKDYQYPSVEKILTRELEKRVTKAKREGVLYLSDEQVNSCYVFFDEIQQIIDKETEKGGKTPKDILSHLYELYKTGGLSESEPIVF